MIFLVVLYSEEKEPTCLNASRNSSWGNAFFRMDGGKICTGRPQYIFCPPKYLRTHRDVFLLHGSRDGTAIPKVYLVEEISDYHANGKFSISINITSYCYEFRNDNYSYKTLGDIISFINFDFQFYLIFKIYFLFNNR